MNNRQEESWSDGARPFRLQMLPQTCTCVCVVRICIAMYVCMTVDEWVCVYVCIFKLILRLIHCFYAFWGVIWEKTIQQQFNSFSFCCCLSTISIVVLFYIEDVWQITRQPGESSYAVALLYFIFLKLINLYAVAFVYIRYF